MYGSITPSSARARRDRTATRRRGAARARSAGRAAQQRRLDRPEPPAAGGSSRRHQRERLLLAVLARPQSRPPLVDARHARWNPPMPLTATIAPRSSAATSSSAWSSRGPQAGQALGWAWKRRSPGRRTRPRRRAHREAGHRGQRPVVRDAATIVKRGRSRAVDNVAVARSPVEQLAQARLAGRASGERARPARPRARTIANPSRRARTTSCSTRRHASGGASAGSRRAAPRRSGAPSPRSRRRARRCARTRRAQLGASRCTYGRKPTPWTTPSTRTRTRRVGHPAVARIS